MVDRMADDETDETSGERLERHGVARRGPRRGPPGRARLPIPMLRAQAEIFPSSSGPALTAQGIQLLEWADVPPAQREVARRFFRASIFPVLTPLAVDPGHPFPFISNLSDSLGVILS